MAGNVYAVILAGGMGIRMGNTEKPKQFIEIGNKPIVIHTIEKFYVHSTFDKILVLTPVSWMRPMQDLIDKYFNDNSKIVVLEGGQTRNLTIMNSINYIEKNNGLDNETIIVTHDAVRPFVTYRIIEDNIEFAKEYGACDTVISATDTIAVSSNNTYISDIPDRRIMYQGQTPQSFNAKKLKEIYESLSDDEKNNLTDAAKIMVLAGEKVHLVTGEVSNIKITYPYDIRVAQVLLDSSKNVD